MLDIVPSKSLFKRETSGGRQAEEGKALMEREDIGGGGAANLSLPLVLEEAAGDRSSQGLGCSASSRPQG